MTPLLGREKRRRSQLRLSYEPAKTMDDPLEPGLVPV